MLTSRIGNAAACVVAAFLVLLPAGCSGGDESGGSGADARTAAGGRVDTFVIVMPELESRQRTIRVYLPPGYDAARDAYPVLYLQDGQNLFTPGPYGDWLVDETADELARTGRLPGIIIVGIDNSEHRISEYGPWVNTSMHRLLSSSWAPPVAGGEGARYVDFLVGTLKPEIDRRYRTLPRREATGIGGSSMGGIISVYAALVRPDIFSRVMAMSPAVMYAERDTIWLAGNHLLEEIDRRPPPRDVRFWIDIGTAERSRDTDPDLVDATGAPLTYERVYEEGARVLAERLVARGVPAREVRLTVDSGAVHHESAWAARLPHALLWLYGETPR